MSLEEYATLFIDQEGKCFICKKEETARNAKTAKLLDLAVDHDHVTGKIRKLLCGKCNRALGLIKEDLGILESMKNYILQHKE